VFLEFFRGGARLDGGRRTDSGAGGSRGTSGIRADGLTLRQKGVTPQMGRRRRQNT
jgi:hypothetical protein